MPHLSLLPLLLAAALSGAPGGATRQVAETPATPADGREAAPPAPPPGTDCGCGPPSRMGGPR